MKNLGKELIKMSEFSFVKFFVFVDYPVNVEDIELTVWIAAGNIEPLRDCFVFASPENSGFGHLIIDGTRKRADIDNFKRDWPNIVVADDETIENVDKKWEPIATPINTYVSTPDCFFGT